MSFQSRRWPGSAVSNKTFSNDDLLDRELFTLSRFIAICAKGPFTYDVHSVCGGVPQKQMMYLIEKITTVVDLLLTRPDHINPSSPFR